MKIFNKKLIMISYSNYTCWNCSNRIKKGRSYYKVYMDNPMPILRICMGCEDEFIPEEA